VAREIVELVNKALGQVPGHKYVAEAADGQSPEVVLAATDETGDSGAELPDVVSIALENEQRDEETDVQADTSAAPLAEDLIIEAHDEPTPESAPVVDLVDTAPLYGQLRADTDFYACPVAAEFRAQRAQETSSALELSADFLYTEDDHPTGLRIPWGAIAASILLAVLLLAQLAWFERYQLVRLPQLRAALEYFCQPLNCDLPLRHDISRIEMVEREVRDHPHAPAALLINASFANRAGFTQAYPVFVVSFSDVSGTPVAVRRFPPAEYLIGRQDVSNGMAPGERAQLMLEVVDPGDRAVSFQFDFL